MVDIVLWLHGKMPLAVEAKVERAEVGHGMGVRFVHMGKEKADRLRGHLIALRVRAG